MLLPHLHVLFFSDLEKILVLFSAFWKRSFAAAEAVLDVPEGQLLIINSLSVLFSDLNF